MSRIVSKTIDLAGQGATEVSKYITNIGDDGIKVHPYNNTTGTIDQNNYTKIDSNGMEIWQEDNDTSIKVAEFGVDGAIIGKSDGSQSYLYEDYHSLQMVDKEGETYFWASDLRDSGGKVTEYFTGDGVTTEFDLIRAADSYAHRDVTITIDGVETTAWNVRVQTFVFNTAPADGSIIAIKYLPISTNLKGYSIGYRKENSTIGGYSVVEGDDNVASGYTSHAEGRGTEASGNESHSEGWGSIASGGRSHAEGNDSIASGECSHAEGEDTFAIGRASHAEGRGFGGQGAEGDYSHVEGYHTRATGECSHAQNEGTRALSDAQTALGKYNIADTNDTYTVIIGNGSSGGSRSNALTVDWGGNINIAIDTTAISGDDFDLYTAISNLEWTTNVIV